MGWEVYQSRSQPNVIPDANDIDLAWTAGIIEGEGNFEGVRGGIMITVGQKDPWILYRLQELFGGSIGEYAANGPRNNHRIWRWRVCGGRARGLAIAIESYLSPRRVAQLTHARRFIKHA